MRVGIGYDIHRLVSGRDLVLGGIAIPFEKGLLGHSDADVLVHALCDAVLGAAGLGDIGLHFPDSDPDYQDVYSISLLKKTIEMIEKKSFSVLNMDATIFAEAPKLSSFKNEMCEKISETLGIEPGQVNIKATTTEGLGVIGKGEGIGAMCIVLIGKKNAAINL